MSRCPPSAVLALFAVFALLGLIALACGPAVATPTPVPSPTLAAPPATGGPVAIDPDLLAYLPAAVDGFAIFESPEAEAEALADPHLEGVASAIAAGLAGAVDASGGQFVYALVVRLRPGAMTDAAFADWRDAYDAGACARADGVAEQSETEIGGRTVYTGTCIGGLRTFHAWLQAGGILVSASAVGDADWGSLLMGGLRP